MRLLICIALMTNEKKVISCAPQPLGISSFVKCPVKSPANLSVVVVVCLLLSDL